MKRINLTKGRFALVDDEDYDWLSQWNWYYHGGYAARMTNHPRKVVLMHREILKAKPSQFVDHENVDGLDNQRSNIRIATRSQNQCNRHKQSNGNSKYKGVHYVASRNKWLATIGVNNKSIQIGRFDKEIHAAVAYDLWARVLHKEFARTNFSPV